MTENTWLLIMILSAATIGFSASQILNEYQQTNQHNALMYCDPQENDTIQEHLADDTIVMGLAYKERGYAKIYMKDQDYATVMMYCNHEYMHFKGMKD